MYLTLNYSALIKYWLQEPEKKPSGIPLICGSLNWDVMGREKSRVNASKKNSIIIIVSILLLSGLLPQDYKRFRFSKLCFHVFSGCY